VIRLLSASGSKANEIELLGPRAALPNEKRHIPLNVDSLSRLIAGSRRQRNYTQKELARLAGVSQAWISLVERGRTKMDLALVLRVLEALDLRIALEVGKRPRDNSLTVQTFEAADKVKI
jgi:DNA-binding XRE family transcriptional regulator